VVVESDATEDEDEEEEEEEEEENPEGVKAFTFKRRKGAADELTDTAESSPSGQYDDDADQVPFVDAAPKASTAPTSKRTSGAFADEEELMFEL
jgi:hypothetical protein